MNVFILLHVTASLFYLYLAGFILSRGLRDGLNRVFSLLCALFGLWAASFAVMHAFHAPEMAYAAYTISALAWCLYSGMAAHVLLYIAGSGLTRNPWFVTALYAPGILLLAMQWTGHFLGFALYRHPLGWIEIPLTDSPWYWFFILYQVLCISVALIILVRWGLRSPLRRERKQSAILTICISFTFLLCFISDILLPLIGVYAMPSLSPLIIVLLAAGTLFTIVRYQLLSLSLAFASGEILKRIRDVVVLLDPGGTVLKVNAWAGTLLGSSETELAGRPFTEFLRNRDAFRTLFDAVRAGDREEFSLEDALITRSGGEVPHRISGSAMHDREGDIIAVLIIAHDLTEKILLRREIEQGIATAAELRQSREVLSARNEQIEEQLLHAQRIQRALLPQSAPITERVRTDFRSNSMDAVGGDYFSFAATSEGLGLLIGDVSGHGVSAALFLALLKSESERIFRTSHRDPAGFIGTLNLNLLGAMPGHYLTAAYAFFSWTGQGPVSLAFSKGGHPEPVLQRSGRPAEFLVCHGPVIGHFAHATFGDMRLELGTGDRVFFYTDGIVETRTADGELFGYVRLLALIDEFAHLELSDALDRVEKAIASFRGAAPAEDDSVVIGCEIL